MDKDLLVCTLGRHGVENLQPRSTRRELGILGQDLVKHLGAVCRPKGLGESLLQGNVLPAVGVDLVHHLDGEGQTDSVHAQTLDFGHDGRDGLVLKTLGDHDIGCSGPVGTGIGQVGTGGITDPASGGYERPVGPWRASVEVIFLSWSGEREADKASEDGDEPHVGWW